MNEQPTLAPMQPQDPSKALSIISLIAGILGLLSGLVALLSIPLGITAIVLGIVGIKKQAGKGLAIAGITTGSIGILIGLVATLLVLLAVPALQENQDDTQVKNDVSAAVSGINSFRSVNQGALPSAEEFASSDFKNLYLDGIETDLDYTPGTDCEGNNGGRLSSVRAALSDGGDYCLDS